ncbi:MAG: NAD(P)H-dependent oxidoreductase [Planctomycetota bacterium]
MPKKTLVVLGHPRPDSFNAALADAYARGVSAAGGEVRRISPSELDFEVSVRGTSAKDQPVEDDIVRSREAIEWCEHLAIVHPTWWGSTPAILKGWIDRVFVSNWAFRYPENSKLWEGLLKGRSARVITTMDSPPMIYQTVFGGPGVRQLKTSTLWFCGFKPVKTTLFGPIGDSTEAKRRGWLERVTGEGGRDAS